MIETWEALLPILRSPCCRVEMCATAETLHCRQCNIAYGEKDGILVLLPPETNPTDTGLDGP